LSDYPYLADIIVVAIIGLSALFGFIRGFLREVLSIGAWIVAGLAAWFGWHLLLPYLVHLPYVGGFFAHDLIGPVATALTIFLVVLVVASVISHMITRSVRESSLGPLDRSLGILFGVARGAVIVSVALLILDNFGGCAPDNRPAWLKDARTLPVVQIGADIVRQLVPVNIAAQAQSTADTAKQQAQKAMEVGQAIQIITDASHNRPASASGTDSASSTSDSGYNDADRKAMDRALQSVQ
jgi:membrane protein required for colicin V production